ncbi:MAG: TlpA family protein disulfide reductase [Armatimonadetes bacterium]|nr:TlpA family protein disulfide reductase [Armatimonadota bacterium]
MLRRWPGAVVSACALFALCLGLSAQAAPDVGARAPSLRVKDLSGKVFDLSKAVQSGPVFVNFWASWCIPCQEEFPVVSRLAQKWQKQKMSFIAVAVKDKKPGVQSFIKKQKPAQRVALDDKDTLFKGWDLEFIPVSYLVGKGGKIVALYDQFDASDAAAIERDFRKAVDAYKKPGK